MSFEFQTDSSGILSIEEAVFQALGAASVCWEQLPSGVFNGERAEQVGKALLNEVLVPRLGLATTRELLDELRARIETGAVGLDYTTVGGTPR